MAAQDPSPEMQGTPSLTTAMAVLVAGQGGGKAPRDTVLALFRRHLARVQQQVREGFESYQVTGLEAAHLLSGHADELIVALHEHAESLYRPEGVLSAGHRQGAGRSTGTRGTGKQDVGSQGTGQSAASRGARQGDATEQDAGAKETLAIVATGGYGRSVLAPFSDIDLLFLTPDQPSPRLLWRVEYMLYFLWDLGLKVGHATRSVAQCLDQASRDVTVTTTLLDARLIDGDTALFDEFRRQFTQSNQHNAGSFLAAKQAERAARHRRFGESAYLVEPNIKEGRGGLRDLQTLYWMMRYVLGPVFERLDHPESVACGLLNLREVAQARRAWDFLWSVRFHLHYVSGRAEERLTFDLQPVVGARIGYTRHGRQDGVERFMRHYFLTAREVNRLTLVLEPAILRQALGPPALAAKADPALRAQGFGLADGKLVLAPGHNFREDPLALLRVLEVARERDVGLHPLTLRALIRDERCAVALRGEGAASDIFLDLLCGRDTAHNRVDGAQWMRILNETGLLGRYLPDWARIVGQMQFDTYHVFTVDEHTIEAIAVVNRLERNELSDVLPVATGIVEDLQSRRALYVATLLHDIAKGRGGDHSELGAELALEIGPQLGLSAEETETISWLVLHHLLLSQTAFRRDIDDPKTILDLADTIQSPERLKLLLVLTVADMRAVSPRVWNGWKATLLRELYSRVAEVLAGGLATTERDVRVARSKEACDENLAAAGWSKADRDAFLALGYGGYWLSFDPETHVRHAHMVRDAEARRAPLLVETQALPARAVTEVTVYVTDHAGLVSRIAGALAVAGASIVDARVHTLTNGRALDTFWIQDAAGGAFDAPHRLAKLSVLIEQALAGELSMDAAILKAGRALMGSRMRAIHVPPRVVVDNRASNTHTVLEVNGRDRPGLMHDVTAAISEQGVQIASAHVTTYGVRAVDVFYVKDVFGLKIENERKLALLREALLQALTSPDSAGPLPAAPARRRRDAA